MKSLLIKTLFAGFIFFLGCNDNSDISSDWKSSLPILPSELHVKRGDSFYFKDSANKYFLATLMNFHKSEDGIWYGMCFTDYYDTTSPNVKLIDSLNFCGRRVMYSTPDRYKIGFDIVWLRDSVVDNNNVGLIKRIDLSDVDSVDLSAEQNVTNFKEFGNAFHESKFKRKLPPDHYSDLTKDHLRTDDYFTLQYIIEWRKSFNGK